jgi:acetyl-CoA C-acetyltransferase
MGSATVPDAFIIDAVRTPIGRRGGGLAKTHPADLAGVVLTAVLDRTGLDAGAVDDVVFGCVAQVGAQSYNVARTAWLSAGLPETVPATTIDRQCGSSQQALHFAAQGVQAGAYDVAVAGGVEVMSLVPIGSAVTVGEEAGLGSPLGGAGWRQRYGDVEMTQYRSADLLAERWDIPRERMELLALESHARAARAWDEGRFASEVVAVDGLAVDEGIRRDASLDAMARLPTLRDGGRISAATSSQISDAAAAVLVASATAVESHGLRPRARIAAQTVVGSDPELMLTGPAPATERALKQSGLAIDDIDRFEINEAFASVVLVWSAETGADLERTNVNGGAIALGHPLGATGARMTATLLAELERCGGRFGLQTLCEGGGMANCTILERVT